eukprot:1394486-Amorphochlora_amoeboformis.AAC.2
MARPGRVMASWLLAACLILIAHSRPQLRSRDHLVDEAEYLAANPQLISNSTNKEAIRLAMQTINSAKETKAQREKVKLQAGSIQYACSEEEGLGVNKQFLVDTLLDSSAPINVDYSSITTQFGNCRQMGVVTLTDNYVLTQFGGSSATAVVLSSGNVNLADDDTNPNGHQTTKYGGAGDSDLNVGTAPYSTKDASILQFDFTPTTDGNISFSFVFGSEEYTEYVDSSFNDAFGFYLSDSTGTKENVAFIPGTSQHVTINNLNHGDHSDLFTNNDKWTSSTLSSYTSVKSAFDGLTKSMNTRLYEVTSGETYTAKLAIADAGDTSFDSMVYLKASSFNFAQCGNGILESGEECEGGECCSSICTLKSSSTLCRAATDDCDVAEYCTEVAPVSPSLTSDCPADSVKAGGDSVVCRASTSPTDMTEYCDGTNKACPIDDTPYPTPYPSRYPTPSPVTSSPTKYPTPHPSEFPTPFPTVTKSPTTKGPTTESPTKGIEAMYLGHDLECFPRTYYLANDIPRDSIANN